MNGHNSNGVGRAGPILLANTMGRNLALLIKETNPGTLIADLGSYLRVSTPGRCVLLRTEVEKLTGTQFLIPADLEVLMPSFKGKIEILDDRVTRIAFINKVGHL
jgi:hypothetical protein